MSVSDPAPLPRLGEVFFDVRGNSRSMRLSWYADTGVAVFSIWQAGMCTGTFRLPMADLSRMIEILQRGPSPRRRGPAPVSSADRTDRGSDRRPGEYRPGDDDFWRGSADSSSPAGYAHGDFTADIGLADYRGGDDRPGAGQPDHGSDDYRAADYGARGYAADDRGGSGEYGAVSYGGSDARAAGHPSADDRPADYELGQHTTSGDYQSGSYEPPGYGSRDYGRGVSDYLTGDYATGGLGDDYRAADYGDRRDYQIGSRGRERGAYQPELAGDSFADAGAAGYHDDRFVPPYVRGQGEAYLNDNPGPGGGHPSGIGGPPYPADRQLVSPSDGYLEESEPQDGYSYGSEYRYR